MTQVLIPALLLPTLTLKTVSLLSLHILQEFYKVVPFHQLFLLLSLSQLETAFFRPSPTLNIFFFLLLFLAF